MTDLAKKARTLLEAQNRSWTMLRENRAQLAAAESRMVDFGKFAIRVQYNPGRLASSMAQLDEHSIRKRECFLCDSNRPAEQATLPVGDGFKLMCNPFPILPEHFTIVNEKHQPQRILGSFPMMLDLAARFSQEFVVFYNGPQCGASAPDHLHLQAGTRGVMRVDIDCLKVARPLTPEISVGENYLRRFFMFESNRRERMIELFDGLYRAFHALQPKLAEPLMNVICTYENKRWRLIVFPRIKHRPSFYFEPEHLRLLLSPGTVDMGGLVILPLEKDYLKLTREHLAQMYEEVTLPAREFEKICRLLDGEPGPAGRR
ncbi:MAG TPA: DUF4922 domain-containing protein [Tepidisphaeraceae bacterium]|nr:DUF4922 domain-containing protein [Tepidisphaeraceae bacterium]